MKLSSQSSLPSIVFLHIPKTAGQTVHSALCDLVREKHVSPVRVHSQVGSAGEQLPPGYGLYSGHLDWSALESVGAPRFVFTILRDPRERIASFYFYLRHQAKALSPEALNMPENFGKKQVLTQSARAYFFEGSAPWKLFVRDHYDNFYTSYFATRKMRGWEASQAFSETERALAIERNLTLIDGIYHCSRLSALERDLGALAGREISFSNKVINAGPAPRDELRWPKLMALLPDADDRAALEEFVRADMALLARLGMEG